MKHCVDLAELSRLYTVEKLTSRQIGEIVGIPFRTVLRYLGRAGVELRNPGDPLIQVLADREWLEERYIGQKRSTTDIAAEIGCEARSVWLWLRRHDIPTRSRGSERGHERATEEARRKMSEAGRGKKIGPDNPNWKGGVPYVDPERRTAQTRTWAQAVKRRDGWKCVECDSTEHLHSHHIKSWRRHPELRHDIANGITLCRPCHEKEHSFRFKHAKRPTSAPPLPQAG